MKNKDEHYAAIDSRLKKNPAGLIAFAKKKRGKNGKLYRFYSEMIFQEYKFRTARSICEEIRDAGLPEPFDGQIWNIKHQIEKACNELTPEETIDKTCYMCGKRKVPAGNHALCRICDNKSKGVNVDHQHYVSNNCSF